MATSSATKASSAAKAYRPSWKLTLSKMVLAAALLSTLPAVKAAAGNDTIPAAIQAQLDDLAAAVDQSYILHCAFLIFFMKAGFIMLEYGACGEPESGLARHSPIRADLISFKLLDTCVAAIAYFFIGFNVFATNKFEWVTTLFGRMPDDEQFLATVGINWVLHYGFAQDAATIVTGAVIGRVDIRGYLMGTFLLVAILEPLVARWVWTTGGGVVSGVLCNVPTLTDCVDGRIGNGFLDFAGATVVHMVGGVSAFACAIFCGEGRRQTVSDSFFSCLGALVLWFGWYGFNTGAANGMSHGRYVIVSQVAASMTIATAVAGITMFFYDLYKRKSRAAEPTTADVREDNKLVTHSWLADRRVVLSAFSHGRPLPANTTTFGSGVPTNSMANLRRRNKKAPVPPKGVQFEAWNQNARDLADRYILVAEFALRYNAVVLMTLDAMKAVPRAFMLTGDQLQPQELALLDLAHAARTFCDAQRSRVERGYFVIGQPTLRTMRNYCHKLRSMLPGDRRRSRSTSVANSVMGASFRGGAGAGVGAGTGTGTGTGTGAGSGAATRTHSHSTRATPQHTLELAPAAATTQRTPVRAGAGRKRVAASPVAHGMLMNVVWCVKVLSKWATLPTGDQAAASEALVALTARLQQDPTIGNRALVQQDDAAGPSAAGTPAAAADRSSAATMLEVLGGIEERARRTSVVHTQRFPCTQENLQKQLFRLLTGKLPIQSDTPCLVLHFHPRFGAAVATPGARAAAVTTTPEAENWFTVSICVDKERHAWELGSAKPHSCAATVAVVGACTSDTTANQLAGNMAREFIRRAGAIDDCMVLLEGLVFDQSGAPITESDLGFAASLAKPSMEHQTSDFHIHHVESEDDLSDEEDTVAERWHGLSWQDMWASAPLTSDIAICRMDVGEWIGMTNRSRTMPAEQDELTKWAHGQRVHVTGLLPKQVRVLYFLGYRWRVRWEDCDLNDIINAVLTGLVAITACANVIPMALAPLVGVVAVPFYLLGKYFERHIGVFDLCSAFPVHGMGGLCGIIMTGILGSTDPFGRRDDRFTQYFNHPFNGNYGTQVAIQIVGGFAVMLSIFSIAFVFYWLLWSMNILALEDNMHEFPLWWRGHCPCFRGRLNSSGKLRGGCKPFSQWWCCARCRCCNRQSRPAAEPLLSRSTFYGLPEEDSD